MAHNIEVRADGTALCAYAGDVPWHGLGTQVPADLTPEQMLEAAGRSQDTRLQSAWYGTNKVVKTRALEIAVDMAEAA